MREAKLRIAQITRGLDVGGQERLLVEMARHRDAEHFEWTVIVLGQRGPLADELENLGVAVQALGKPPGVRLSLWVQLATLFRRHRFDAVHTHDDQPLVYGMPAARVAGVRQRIHTHHHGHIVGIGWRHQKLVRWSACFARHFVCVSKDSANYMIAQGVPARRVSTVWNGIDLNRFAYEGPCDNGPIVTVARLSVEKDIANLLEAASWVVARFPQARFEIAGDGPCRNELERLTKVLQLADHVKFLGEVQDIPSLLARAGLFVLPSKTEGISLTLLEAMARGLPIVATAVGGNTEVVESEITGLLIPPADSEQLGRAIVTMLADSDRRRKMGLAGRRRVEELFDIRRMMPAYERLYAAGRLSQGVGPQSGIPVDLAEAK